MTSSKVAKFFQIHFLRAQFGLKNASQTVFYYSQWSAIPKLAYVVYRLLLSMYFLTWLGLTIVYRREGALDNDQPFPKWYFFLKLTNWTFTLFNAYLIVSALNVTINYLKTRKSHSTIDITEETNQSLPILSRIHWLLFNLQAGMNLVLLIGYWTAVMPFRKSKASSLEEAVSYHVHLVNILASLGDIFMVSIPVNLAHAIFSMTGVLSYCIFSVIYWASGGLPFPLYPTSNYEQRPAIAAGSIVLMTLILAPLTWLIVFGLSKLRVRLWRRYDSCGKTNVPDISTESEANMAFP